MVQVRVDFISPRHFWNVDSFAYHLSGVKFTDTGKSNLMDAVSFVLGVKAATLRGQSMKVCFSIHLWKMDVFLKTLIIWWESFTKVGFDLFLYWREAFWEGRCDSCLCWGELDTKTLQELLECTSLIRGMRTRLNIRKRISAGQLLLRETLTTDSTA